MESDDLFLSGLCAIEWNRFITALKSVGVSLTDDLDALLWAGGDATGNITVKTFMLPSFNN